MGKVLFPDYFPNRCPPYDDSPRWWTAELAGYMRMIWRVKKWEFIINITSPYSGWSTDIIGEHKFIYKSEATTEEELVCIKGLEFESGNTSFETYDMQISPYFTSFQSFSPYSSMGARASDSGSYDNGIDQGDLPIPDGPQYSNYVKNLSTVNIENFGNDIAYSPFTAFTTTGQGEDFNLYYTARVRAKEYWSYGGTYNTETGEPL